MPVRWERTEKLLVWEGGLRWRLANYRSQEGQRLFTQRRFLASHDGRWLAYAHGDGLKARAADGSTRVLDVTPRKDFRFAHDGSLITVGGQGRALMRASLESGETTSIATLPGWVEWMECYRSGVAVQWYKSQVAHISLVSWSGERRDLFEAPRGKWIQRLMASREADRVAWVQDDTLFAIDAARRGARPRKLGFVGSVSNGEMSPDGERIAVANERGLVGTRGNALPRKLLGQEGIHSVWYSTDSKKLLAASTHRAVVFSGATRADLKSKAPIRTARFNKDGAGVLLARGQQVDSWRPGYRPRLRAKVAAPDLALGAAQYDGGLIVWTGSPFEEHLW